MPALLYCFSENLQPVSALLLLTLLTVLFSCCPAGKWFICLLWSWSCSVTVAAPLSWNHRTTPSCKISKLSFLVNAHWSDLFIFFILCGASTALEQNAYTNIIVWYSLLVILTDKNPVFVLEPTKYRKFLFCLHWGCDIHLSSWRTNAEIPRFGVEKKLACMYWLNSLLMANISFLIFHTLPARGSKEAEYNKA